MTKNQIKQLAFSKGIQCNYSGNTKTMYLTGPYLPSTDIVKLKTQCNFNILIPN